MYADLIAGRTHSTCHNGIVGAVESYKSCDLSFVILHKLTHALQVSETFLSGACHKQDAALWNVTVLCKPRCQKHHDRKVGGIVANAGASHDIAVIYDIKGLHIREHRIKMGRVGQEILTLFAMERVDHI